MKELLHFLLGIVLSIVGVVMFLQNVVVSNFTLFYRMGRVNVGGILILLIVVAFITFLVMPNMLTGLSLIGLCVVFFVCLVISLNVSIRYMTGLELALELGTLCVGVAFVIKGLLGVNKADKEKKTQKK
ncbi:MAG: hypothetical protein ACI4L2_03010 [Wujia sp.]